MINLSKSKLLAHRQCPKRLWLEIHRPKLIKFSAATIASFKIGQIVGDIARQIYDPAGKRVLLNAQRDGYDTVFKRSAELLESSQPICEAGFVANGAQAFADVMLPVRKNGKRMWRMIEVKSTTEIEEYHRDDVAIQSFIARKAGVPLVSIILAHINSDWIYPGGGDYSGLFKEHDLTPGAFSRDVEVRKWISAAKKTVAKRAEPKIGTGEQCNTPYDCEFIEYCQSQEPQAKYPVYWLPNIRTDALKMHIAENPALDLRDTPDELLNVQQLRVKKHTLSDKTYFDAAGAAAALKPHKLPAYFLDFETLNFAVPIWKGTRPYQQIPFQFSLHTLGSKGKLDAWSFIDLSGNDPSRAFAESIVNVCGNRGPIFVYNAGFEGARINELAERFLKLAPALLAIKDRLVDLLPITKAHYYHPSQHGSWGIKAVLPAIAPDLSYEELEGVQNGGMVMDAYLDAIHPATTPERKSEIEQQLITYCGLDTFAMVRLWQLLAGRNDLKL